MKEQIEELISRIRPSLQADGGDIEFVSVDNNVVKVRLTGACGSCPMSEMTLKNGVEALIRQHIPEITSVEAV